MGYDATVYIDKGNQTKKSIENLILLMGYKKTPYGFYCGNDIEYKYNSGVFIYQPHEDKHQDKIIVCVRASIWASSYDLEKMNETLRMFRQYCNASFISDYGKNRYFIVGEKKIGAENGCYLAVSNLTNNINYLRYSLSKFPEDKKEDAVIATYGFISPWVFNANVYSAYLCAIMEEFFRSTYIALLRYSSRKEKLLSSCKFSAYDLVNISSGEKSIEEAYARTLSFQNINIIVKNFKDLDSKIDIGAPLKRPYHRRKKTLFAQIDEIFERRHKMVHHVDLDNSYRNKDLANDIEDVDSAIKRVYNYICEIYGWCPQEIIG